MPAVTLNSPIRKRVPPGAGAAHGRMTMDPGVTCFSFAASFGRETALDASLKAHQQGAMSFFLQEALQQLRNKCTYEQLLHKACEIADDVREKYMPRMDQHIHLSFCPNSAPTEVVFLDARYATVAQHRLKQRAKLERGRSGDVPVPVHNHNHPNVECETDFVPAPMGYGNMGGQYAGPQRPRGPGGADGPYPVDNTPRSRPPEPPRPSELQQKNRQAPAQNGLKMPMNKNMGGMPSVQGMAWQGLRGPGMGGQVPGMHFHR